MDENIITHMLVCTSHSCLAKEDPDNNVSICPLRAGGTGSFVQTSTRTCWSDPTQSTCCDESQLLLGFPPHHRGVHQSRFTHGTIGFPVSGRPVPPYDEINNMLFIR